MPNYRESLRIPDLSLDKLADTLYGASREIIDERNRPMFINELSKELARLSFYYYPVISNALVKHAANFSAKHGLYLIEIGDAIIKVHGKYDELKGSKPKPGTPLLQKISRNMSLLYRTENELRKFIEERTSVETVRVVYFKL